MANKVVTASADGIIDNSPEMDYTSPEFAAVLAGGQAKKVDAPKDEAAKEEKVEEPSTEETGEETPVEETEDEASPATEEEKEAEKSDDPKLKALAKELKRVRALNKERDASLSIVTQKLEVLEKKVSAAPLTADDQMVAKLVEMTDEKFADLNVRWSDELADAKAEYVVAKERGDEALTEKSLRRIETAKRATELFTKAVSSRATKKAEAENVGKAEVAAIATELDSIKKAYDTAFPELSNTKSPIFKAGLNEYKANPKLMEKLGPIGELVATALAIIKNPKLVGRDPSAVRKELVTNLEETVSTALKTAGGVGSSKGGKASAIPQFKDLTDFNEYIERIKNS